LVLSTISMATSAKPGTEPNAARGKALATRLCQNCHVIGPDAAPVAGVPAGVPSFAGIANRDGQTGAAILDALIKPHAPMPDMQLEHSEALDLIAYLETLRTNPAVPPLISPKKPYIKPKYPTPS
jgi:mono/diheme cytochrome c family protein